MLVRLGLIVLLSVPGALAHASDWAPEFGPGAALPAFEAPDQTGTIRTNEDLMGQNGAVYFFNRSTSW